MDSICSETDVWKGDVWAKLRASPEMKAYVDDPYFIKTINTICSNPSEELRHYMEDPRVMQAMVILMGQPMAVTEDDLRQAEREGRIPLRSPINPQERMEALTYETSLAAKEAGNRSFQVGNFTSAIACYERSLDLCAEEDKGQRVILLSNIAQSYLKLERFKEAEEACVKAIPCIPSKGDAISVKVLYRLGTARYKQGIYRLSEAIKDMEKALELAMECDLQDQIRTIRGELKALKTQENELEKKKKEEKASAYLAQQGSPLKADKDERVPNQKLSEQDYSFKVTAMFNDLLKSGSCPTPSGGHIELKGLISDNSKIMASIVSKGGKRRLFYDFDLSVKWHGTSFKCISKKTEPNAMDGVIRVYNVGQDTKYNPGGNPSVSYTYSLGFPANHNNPVSEPWVTEIKEAANDLFEVVVGNIAIVTKYLLGV